MKAQIAVSDRYLEELYCLPYGKVVNASGYNKHGDLMIWAIQNYGNFKGKPCKIRLKDGEYRILTNL